MVLIGIDFSVYNKNEPKLHILIYCLLAVIKYPFLN